MIIGDTIAQNPYGHTAVFCRRVFTRTTEYVKYIPVVGFFWSFIASNSTTVQSLSEYFHTRAAPSQLVTLHERIPHQNKKRFREVFGMMAQTVNREMHLLETRQRILRNIMGTNRTRPTRWRAIIGREPPVEVAKEKKKAAPKRPTPKRAVPKRAAPKEKSNGRK